MSMSIRSSIRSCLVSAVPTLSFLYLRFGSIRFGLHLICEREKIGSQISGELSIYHKADE